MSRTLAALALGLGLAMGAVPAHGADLPATLHSDAWLTYQGEWMSNESTTGEDEGCASDFDATYLGARPAGTIPPMGATDQLVSYTRPGIVHYFGAFVGC